MINIDNIKFTDVLNNERIRDEIISSSDGEGNEWFYDVEEIEIFGANCEHLGRQTVVSCDREALFKQIERKHGVSLVEIDKWKAMMNSSKGTEMSMIASNYGYFEVVRSRDIRLTLDNRLAQSPAYQSGPKLVLSVGQTCGCVE